MNVLAGKHEAFETLNAEEWSALLQTYRTPYNFRAVYELLLTLGLFAVLWVATYASLQVSYILTLALSVPSAGMLLRIFMIQHDCGHGSYFSDRKANDWIGRILGVLTFTPYDYWKRNHAIHHASSGSLDHRGVGDIQTLTIEEYKNRSGIGKAAYRLYRNPITLFVIGPAYVFLLEQRLPIGMMKIGWRPWVSTMGTNIGILAIAGGLIYLIGWQAFLMVQVPVTLIAASIGVWMFFIQHQFEETSWESGKDWNRKEAALYGSSHYDLPQPLRWFTGNIGVHHVHHLCSHIPFYRLSDVLRDFPQLRDVGRITLFESFKCARLALWDHENGKLLSFREAVNRVNH
ncbi:MAG: fatty acid desaturase [Pseudomonadota bacterium]